MLEQQQHLELLGDAGTTQEPRGTTPELSPGSSSGVQGGNGCFQAQQQKPFSFYQSAWSTSRPTDSEAAGTRSSSSGPPSHKITADAAEEEPLGVPLEWG